MADDNVPGAEKVAPQPGETGDVASRSIKLLAGLQLRRGKLAAARELYRLGAHIEPDQLQWTKALALVAIKQRDTEALGELLAQVADAEPGNLTARKKLMHLAARSGPTGDGPERANPHSPELRVPNPFVVRREQPTADCETGLGPARRCWPVPQSGRPWRQRN